MEYGRKCQEEGDFDTLTVKLIINDEDMGILHNDIEDTKYRVAVRTAHPGTVIEMLR